MTERSLQGFFDTLRSAQQANRAIFADWYDIIERIDRCFVRVGENLINPKPVMTGNLLLRCKYAFRTAAGMALAGQIVEAFVMQRSVLEYAGYCLVICNRLGSNILSVCRADIDVAQERVAGDFGGVA